ncbi:MAG: rod shape-determining protein MreC [Methylicorpusculum sp.]|uniref:rod shape-determining protein MreC n=1 Tax=Methylicorpusculum sp. TaxID=2713644 RepID=UPI00271B761C|nr:rod shape-determining protein MreC [Methylicorpusculum sp.]MDO8941284.1 rod shape-determining protein MreC [Methylicorpusculum sp.]MDO9238606.1 rod shape-determining protein MreC [Methylicorpusculum sp.]MDP2180194.1 rod shape-determining protein MreC [Methylicorpusculum sp.]MDP2204251.1 rod shape-determining protein MreC [Methylicorpusculum sp.]
MLSCFCSQRHIAINPLFATGPSLNTRLLVAVLFSLTLLITEHRGTRLESARAALSVLVYPIHNLVDAPVHLVSSTVETVKNMHKLKEENEKLKQDELIYKTQLLKFAALERENIRLRALLEKSFKLGEQVLVAELLSVNLAPYEHVVLVNKGSRFGVHPEQPVLDAYGVVGQIIRALPFSSEVMLITDPSHAIPVQVNRNGLRTIAVGSGQINRIKLPFLPNNSDIKKGDLLITSGLGGAFPQGYPVAVVDEINYQPNKPFAEIYATPKAQLNKSRELLIVWSNREPVPLFSQETPEISIEPNHE